MVQMKFGSLYTAFVPYSNGMGWENCLVSSLLDDISKTYSGRLQTQVENETYFFLENLGNNMVDAIDEDMEHKSI